MRPIRPVAAAALALATGLVSQAQADLVPGRNNNCAAVWDTFNASTTPAGNRTDLGCTDGDPSCDTDRQSNGACAIQLNVCVGQATEACPAPPTLAGPIRYSAQIMRRALISAFSPPDPAAAPVCGTAGTLNVQLRRVPRNQRKPLQRYDPSKPVTLQMKAKGGFQNRLRVQCTPCMSPQPDGTCSSTGVLLDCPLRNPSTLPAQLTFSVPGVTESTGNGGDLDMGWTGSSHNFPILEGAVVKYCLTDCDGSADTSCIGAGRTGDNTLNGSTFGAPLPLLAASVPTCVINRYQSTTLPIVFDVNSGQGNGDINLFSDVYLTGNPTEVCPRCNAGDDPKIGDMGTCSNTARNAGAACRVDGLANVALGVPGTQDYSLSGACIPTENLLQATLDIRLPLTTGTDTKTGPLPCPDMDAPQVEDDSCDSGSCSAECTGWACAVRNSSGECVDLKGGVSQLCCSTNTSIQCFPTKGAGSITRTGIPATSGNRGLFAATFCIARTGSALINTVTGLPGPGALLLPADVTVLPEQ